MKQPNTPCPEGGSQEPPGSLLGLSWDKASGWASLHTQQFTQKEQGVLDLLTGHGGDLPRSQWAVSRTCLLPHHPNLSLGGDEDTWGV
jgi:hypothetical protein